MTFPNRTHDYRIYGLRLRSDWPFPYPEIDADGSPEIQLTRSHNSLQKTYKLSDKVSPNPECIDLEDGSIYIHWPRLMEFVVSADGSRIQGYPLTSDATDTLEAYLFGGVLSFALLRKGLEQLHAAAVVIHGSAVAFMGDPGLGKSTLASALVKRGYPLLTDDLLVIQVKEPDVFARPGLPRLKLFADSAGMFPGAHAIPTTVNSVTGKRILGLAPAKFRDSDVPLRVLYRLGPASSESHLVQISNLSQHDAFVEICKATFNSGITEASRLKGQFQIASRLASSVPVKRLSFKREFAAIPAICDAIIADTV